MYIKLIILNIFNDKQSSETAKLEKIINKILKKIMNYNIIYILLKSNKITYKLKENDNGGKKRTMGI